MKLGLVSSYPPRHCGIAAFTENFVQSICDRLQADEHEIFTIAAVDQHDIIHSYPRCVAETIRQEELGDYLKAAKTLNAAKPAATILQHEFGLYGGQSGNYILSLVHQLDHPLVVILHTVLDHPSYHEKIIMQQLGARAARLVVMCDKAVDILQQHYNIPAWKISKIEHGAPLYPLPSRETAKTQLTCSNRKVLLTFGLISPNKGIETVIEALPAVVDQYPDVLYIVVGRTHPGVVAHQGEAYRHRLQQMVHERDLQTNVRFVDKFVGEAELFNYIAASDICITPFINEAQITSGTLTYSMAAGAVVLSTPYWHALEVLAHQPDQLFPALNATNLSERINDFLEHPTKLEQARQTAREYGSYITWPKIGARYLQLLNTIKKETHHTRQGSETEAVAVPPLKFNHLYRLLDSTGVLQHARFSIPKYQDGYCVDDNARALIAALQGLQIHHKRNDLIIEKTLAFLSYMQRDDGRFHNFMNFEHKILDQVGSEDCQGRAIWALGTLIRMSPRESLFETGMEMFNKFRPNFSGLKSLRGAANAIMGISQVLQRFPTDDDLRHHLSDLAKQLDTEFECNATDTRQWFEPVWAYDNALLPLALLTACDQVPQQAWRRNALRAVRFYQETVFADGYLSLIGSNDWQPDSFAQQPIDAMTTVLLYKKLAQLGVKDARHYQFLAFKWFLGSNKLHLPLLDSDTNGCCDGLEVYGVNRNQGAESTISWLLAHMAVLETQQAGKIKTMEQKTVLAERES